MNWVRTIDNDIALLELSSPAKTRPVKILSNARLATIPLGDPLTLVGRGKTSENAFAMSSQWRQVEIPIIPRSDCLLFPFCQTVTTSQFCAGLPTGGKDACVGDGGSPLYAELGNTFYVAGLVSWGLGCGRPNSPTVYTRIADYASWLALTTSSAVTVT